MPTDTKILGAMQQPAAKIKPFFEHYPRGLTQEDEIMEENFPLHTIVKGRTECELEIFIWMVELS